MDDFLLERRAEVERWALAYLRHAPLSLCVRELNRLIAMILLERDDPQAPRSPVLDVGCGDGFWWNLRDRQGRAVYGVDIQEREIRQAKRHIEAECRDVSKERPFPALRFREVVGNCSLEHVRDIDAALRNLRACTETGGRLVMFVPAPQWGYQGLVQSFLLRHFPRLAMTISGALNGFFQHWHLYEIPVWTHVLERNGWKVVRSAGLGNERAEFLFRLFLPPALLGFLFKSLAGAYPNVALRCVPASLLSPLVRLILRSLAVPLVPANSPTAYEYALVAEAVS